MKLDDPFFQTAPRYLGQSSDDFILQLVLRYFVPDEKSRHEIQTDLEHFSVRLESEVEEWAIQAEKQPPVHVPYDPWGRRIDHIEVSSAWDNLHAFCAEEGVVSLGYARKPEGTHRLHQFAKLYLFHPASAFYSCPLAMTDGAAKLIETFGDEELKERAWSRLTTRNPDLFWTSGQWMTERIAGSDVGLSLTRARKENGRWKLYGEKWFTSAVTSNMAMALARTENEDGGVEEGSRALSLFYVEVFDENNNLNNIEVKRLKDKLGTRAMPTAELELKGVPAKLVGEKGRGVSQIATLFNVTRLYNACCTMGAFRRILALAQDYSKKRVAFGKKLIEHPLHQRTLKEIEAQYDALMLLLFYVVELFDKSERESSTDRESTDKLLRLFTPIIKLYSAKINMQATSELIESFGGAGYIEDTGLPRWLRDAQVFTIWEGTTNVLSLDTLRALKKEAPQRILFEQFDKWIDDMTSNKKMKRHLQICLEQKQKLEERLDSYLDLNDKDKWELHARDLSYSIARVTQGILLAHFCYFYENSKEEWNRLSSSFDVLAKENWVTLGEHGF